MKQHWHDLIQDYLAGNTDPEQTAELEAALRGDPQLRELYLKYAELDVALENQAEAADMMARASLLSGKNGKGLGHRPRWQALAAAAACLIVGFMASSVLWAYVMPRESMFTSMRVPLENPSFENPDHYKPTTRPRAFGVWNGDPAAVVGEDSGVQPREGRSMLRLEPKTSGPLQYSRIEQLIDASAIIPPEGGTVEASFAFCAESQGQASFYSIMIFAFDRSLETPGDVRGNLKEIAIAHAGRRFPVETESHRWRTGSIRMELPPGTHMIMIDIKAHNLPDPHVDKAHFIDDVQATLIVPIN